MSGAANAAQAQRWNGAGHRPPCLTWIRLHSARFANGQGRSAVGAGLAQAGGRDRPVATPPIQRAPIPVSPKRELPSAS